MSWRALEAVLVLISTTASMRVAAFVRESAPRLTRSISKFNHQRRAVSTAAPRVNSASAEVNAASAVEATSYSSDFVREFVARGYMHQCTDLAYLDERMVAGRVSAYLGFDATAPSLHVGSLLQIMILRLLQRTGHKPIVLVGGGTTRIGDPSGKDESRKMLDDDTIAANVASIGTLFDKFLTFGDGETDAVLVNNANWLEDLGYIDFLREYGSHFSINRMLTFDSVKTRLSREQPLTFLEFNYMILQAYDFLELSRRFNVTVQLGGSDQWGNIVNGVELGRRLDGAKLVGITAPLIATADGRKMGKTADGAIWLSADRLSPYDYWQFWRNIADADVARFLKLFTDLPVEEIDAIDLQGAQAINAAKRRLADETTVLLHGAEVLPSIHQAVDALFAGKSSGSTVSAAVPTFSLQQYFTGADSISIVDLLLKAGFVKSKAEAKRLINQGGARLQNVKVENVDASVTEADFQDGTIKISAGKKKHAFFAMSSPS